MDQEIASGSHIIVGSTLILLRGPLIAVTRSLIVISPRLIGVTAGLIPISERAAALQPATAVAIVPNSAAAARFAHSAPSVLRTPADDVNCNS